MGLSDAHIMTQPAARFHVRLHFPVWVLLALPVACAPLFLWLALSSRISPAALEDRWIANPGAEFPIKDGDWAGWGDNPVYLASVSGPWPGGYHRVFWSVRPEGELRGRVDGGNDGWTDVKHSPPGLRARLAGVLQKLPPSLPTPDPRNRVVVAFAINGRWEVRSYPGSGLKEWNDLWNALLPPTDSSAKSTK
jgi:hypothetical protein